MLLPELCNGSFTQRTTGKPTVFLAGSIEITPFLSIIRQATHDKAPQPIYLF